MFSLLLILILFATAASKENDELLSLPIGLYWNNLSVNSVDGTPLLLNFDGFVEKGRVCGVMGPSGSGKSTLLSALGGLISTKHYGRCGRSVNGVIVHRDASKQNIEHVQPASVAWLQQKDSFFSMLTVGETLEMAALLELPHLSVIEREEIVRATMDSLGLAKLEKRRIGGESSILSNQGLSGGELRRLSLARELISSPKLFLGDEPTSGLDSTLSEKVVKLIKDSVRERNIPCLLSIHQPRSSIFRMLDDIILLAPGGRVIYHGKSQDAIKYFKKIGFDCPTQTNPAEFLIDLVSVDSEDFDKALEDELRILKLVEAFKEHQKSSIKFTRHFANLAKSKVEEASVIQFNRRLNPIDRIQRFGHLLLRSWRQNIRNHRVNFIRLIGSAGNALLFSTIFKTVKKGEFSPKSVGDRVAMLTFGVINMSMLALMKTVDLFAKEKPVVQREQLRRQYTSLDYLVSKSLAEIPLDAAFSALFTTVLKASTGIRIGWSALTGTFALMTVAGASLGFAVGALSPSSEASMSTAIPIMVILMTVGVINPSGVDISEPQPTFVKALKQLSPINYAIKAACIAEYQGMEFGNTQKRSRWNFFSSGYNILKDLPKMGGLALVQNGNQVLQELGLQQDTYEGSMKHLGVLSFVFLVMSWIGLHASN